EILSLLSEVEIDHKELFLNADAGFDCENLRQMFEKEKIIANIKTHLRNNITSKIYYYFDEELYNRRFNIENAFAWLVSFKALFILFETSVITWNYLHYIAFVILFLRKLIV
ncbi:IS5/IS1182 family transposase, partial [Elizabethkingia argentiflava]|nr:IS5/IS1182 family transposase [Elizabethkingia argenteiflava]